MAETQTTQTEQTQDEPAETLQTEAVAAGEETPPNEPEAKGEEAEGDGEGEPEQAEAENDDTEAADNEDKEPEAPTKEEPKTDEKHRRAGGWQRKLERQERANLEKDQIIQQLLQQLGGAPKPGASPAKEQSPDEKAAEWARNLIRQERAAELEQERQARAQAEFRRRTAEAKARHHDFEEVMEACDAPVSQAVNQLLLTSEQGPAIMYQLAKNPDELARISALPPLDAAREIGRLEAKASSTASPKTTSKPASRPPAPPTTVNGKSTSTRSLEELPLADYKRAYRSGRR